MKLSKKWWITGFFTLFIIIGTSIYVFSSKKETLTTEELPSVIKDSVAALYFSTTADQDMNRDGLSFAIFIDQHGETKLWEMDGLELGTIHATENTFFLEDRSNVYLVDSTETTTFQMKTEEHTGEVTGYRNGLYYSVYNSGFTKDGGYSSNIRVGNSKGFETIHIPHYLHMSGITDEELLMVAGEDDNISLYRMPLQKDVELEEVASLGPIGDRLGLSAIIKDDGYYYMLISDTQKLTSDIYRINEEIKKVETFPLTSYKDDEDYRVRIPYNLRNAATILDDRFYYVDGMGDVHTYNFKSGEATLAFTLEGASRGSMKMNEQTFFKDDDLYFFRYDKSSEKYVIDTYDLLSGERISELPLVGIDKMFDYVNSKKKRISSYDFIAW